MPSSTTKFVYIIKCEKGSAYKIGIAISPAERLVANQVGCPFELFLFGWVRFKDKASAVHAEDSAHEFYARSNIRGEWYRFRYGNQAFNTLGRIARMVGAIECSQEIQGKTITFHGDDYDRYYIDK